MYISILAQATPEQATHLEGGAVDKFALQGPCFADKTLQQHANRHARRERVWVDDEIRPARENLVKRAGRRQ